MSNKKCPTNEQLQKIIDCQNFNAENLPKFQTGISKMRSVVVNLEKNGPQGGSKFVDYKQKNIEEQALSDANNVINRKIDEYRDLHSNVSDRINHLELLKEYTKNLNSLENYYEKNEIKDNEKIQEIISKSKINDKMAQYYEEQDEKIHTIMHYTKFFYWPVVATILCILLWVSYKFGYLTAVGKYIKKLKNKIVPAKDMKDAVGQKIKERIVQLKKH